MHRLTMVAAIVSLAALGDSKRAPFATRVAPDVQRRVKIRCAELEIRMQDAVHVALTQWLQRCETSPNFNNEAEPVDTSEVQQQ